MSASRRTILAAVGAGLAALEIPAPASASAIDKVAAELFDQSNQANKALMRGDLRGYFSLVSYSDDFTLMSPFGGKPTHASDLTDERIQAMGRFFRNGTLETELVQAYGSAEMVVLAVVERAHVEVGGLPAQDWALRVTLVYRRDGPGWRLAHRHADPLAPGIGLEEAAALARRKVA
jgi:ketosteroid isomerase-like protein